MIYKAKKNKPISFKSKNLILNGLYAFLFFIAFFHNSRYLSAKSAESFVAVSQTAQHPALDEARQGIYDKLVTEGFIPGKNLRWTYQNALGKLPIAVQIAQKFIGQKPDIIITIGTLATQAAVKVSQGLNIPIVFISVTDPVDAKIIPSLKAPIPLITGGSDHTPIHPQFALFQKIIPGLKRIGIIYNPGEINSVKLNEDAIKVGKERGISIILSPASRTYDVKTAALQLVGKVDAIYINNDNTALAAFESIIQVGNDNQLPVFVSDIDMVKQGAAAAFGPNQYQLGQEVGELIIRQLRHKLNGQPFEALPVIFPTQANIVVNVEAAKSQGIAIPKEILDQATVIVANPAKLSHHSFGFK